VFERFTDRARRVVVLAQEEARLLNHNDIGTEHLLLGLIHEAEGVSARVLTGMGVSLEAMRVKIEAIIGQGGDAPTGHIPFTPRAKKVLELSLRAALDLGHTYIGTEHMLLGLLREGEGVAAQVLMDAGLDLDQVQRAVIEELTGYEARGETAASIPLRRGVPRVDVPSSLAMSTPASDAGIRPARCGFCDVPSPESGPLYTGVSGALICLTCVRKVAGQPWTPDAPRSLNVRASLDVRAARYHLLGPPPGDEETARRDIAYAYKHLMEISADGTRLVNVEDGRELKPYSDGVFVRCGPFIVERENVVERVRFLDATHAVVWWKVHFASGRPVPWDVFHEGRAVVVDGAWKVARETVCQRWAEAGVQCPPRRNDSPADPRHEGTPL